MELQEPTLRALVVHFVWDVAPRFFDVRGALTDHLRAVTEEPGDWSWNSSPTSGPMIAAWNEDRGLHLIVSDRGLDIISEEPSDPGPLAADLLPDCLELLAVREISGCGAAAGWLLAAPTKEDASAAIEAAIGAPDLRTRLEGLGGRADSFIVDLEFESDETTTTRLELQPYTAEELIDQAVFLTDIEAGDLPPAAVFARVRRRHLVAMEPAEALTRASRALEGVQRSGEQYLVTLSTS